jgi:hypothetical protein
VPTLHSTVGCNWSSAAFSNSRTASSGCEFNPCALELFPLLLLSLYELCYQWGVGHQCGMSHRCMPASFPSKSLAKSVSLHVLNFCIPSTVFSVHVCGTGRRLNMVEREYKRVYFILQRFSYPGCWFKVQLGAQYLSY